MRRAAQGSSSGRPATSSRHSLVTPPLSSALLRAHHHKVGSPHPPTRPLGERAGAAIGSFRHSKRRLSSAAALVTFSSCFQVTLPSKAAGRRLLEAGRVESASAPCLSPWPGRRRLDASPYSSSCATATLAVPGDSALLAPAAAATASAKAPGLYQVQASHDESVQCRRRNRHSP